MTQTLGMLKNFTLMKLPSIYNNKTTLNEYTGTRLPALIQNNIGVEFSDDNYQKKHYNFTNEQAHLSTLISKFNKKEGCLKIKIKCPDHGWGRIQPEDHASLSVLHRPTRHSICHGIYCDIDMVSCCQSVFKNVAELNGKSYHFLTEYLENRDLIFNKFMTKYNVTKNQIKALFTALSFGGTADAWFDKYNIQNENDPFIIGLENEYQELMEVIYDANPQICNDILKSNPNKFIKYTEPKDLLNKKKRTTMACFYQTAERYLQESMIDFLVVSKGFKLKDIVPCQDGFMILNSLNYNNIIDDCELVIKTKFNFNIKIKIKEFDERFDIPAYVSDFEKKINEKQAEKLFKEQQKLEENKQKEQHKLEENKQKEQQKLEDQKKKEIEKQKKLEEKKQKEQQKLEDQKKKEIEKQANNEMNELLKQREAEELLTTIELRVKEWEKTHFKIINKGVYVIAEENVPIIFKTKKQLSESYEHVEDVQITPIFSQPFIDYWTKNNPYIRSYDDMNIYPNMSKCPKNIYNLWVPFAGECYKGEYIKNLEGLNFFRNHILILCNYDNNVADYFEKWIAQMIQYPDVKTICPVLISNEGSGKGTLLKLLSLLLGTSKYFETTNPNRDVWGNFNSIMSECFLVNLNELTKADTIESLGKIKGLITDDALTINQKGAIQYKITSYHRFIVTSNNADPVPTQKGDRRFIVIRSSDDKKGDHEYFTQANNYMKDESVLRTIYDYFKNIPDMDKFGNIQLPITEYQQNIQDGNTSIVEQWLAYFTLQNESKDEVELLGIETFNLFQTWKTEQNVKYDINCIKLGIQLKNLQFNGILKGKHTKKGETKIFNIKILKKHFGIGLLIDL
jgi:hypothetical protein